MTRDPQFLLAVGFACLATSALGFFSSLLLFAGGAAILFALRALLDSLLAPRTHELVKKAMIAIGTSFAANFMLSVFPPSRPVVILVAIARLALLAGLVAVCYVISKLLYHLNRREQQLCALGGLVLVVVVVVQLFLVAHAVAIPVPTHLLATILPYLRFVTLLGFVLPAAGCGLYVHRHRTHLSR